MCVLIYFKRRTALGGITDERRAGERKLRLQRNGIVYKYTV